YRDIALHRLTMNCGRDQIDDILNEVSQIGEIVCEEGRPIFDREKREALLALDLDEETASSLLADAMSDIALHGSIELKGDYVEQLLDVTFEETLASTEEIFGKGRATVLAIVP
ncbi:MAG TPA: hypothetical protein VFA15_08450, partial [Nitrososphaera sp.]|nr:hypothetical protein [Nitrososphaera sp.]